MGQKPSRPVRESARVVLARRQIPPNLTVEVENSAKSATESNATLKEDSGGKPQVSHNINLSHTSNLSLHPEILSEISKFQIQKNLTDQSQSIPAATLPPTASKPFNYPSFRTAVSIRHENDILIEKEYKLYDENAPQFPRKAPLPPSLAARTPSGGPSSSSSSRNTTIQNNLLMKKDDVKIPGRLTELQVHTFYRKVR
jgi:hypothetical protein